MLKVYPVVFEKDGNGYLIDFPDIQGAFTGINDNDVAYGMVMAEEVLGMVLADMIENGENLPEPTPSEKIAIPDGGLVTLIKVDLQDYFKDITPVKKTLTIPTWANNLGIKEGINFSQLLTTAIAKTATMRDYE